MKALKYRYFFHMVIWGMSWGMALNAGEVPVRMQFSLNGYWQAAKGEDFKAASADSTEWIPILVPGSYWNTPGFSGSKWIWYRKMLYLPSSFSNMKIVIAFDCVETDSELYVNGKLAYKNASGFIPFEVDISPFLKFGADNEIRMRVENNSEKHDFPKPRWNGGLLPPGIVQDVWLMAYPRTHVEYVKINTSVRRKEISTLTEIRNDDSSECNLEIIQYARAGNTGNIAHQIGKKSLTLKPGESREIIFRKPWENPILWGYEPYGSVFLYELVTDIVKNGKLIDRKLDSFGFREFHTDGSSYFFNGKKIFLSGDIINRPQDVNRHILQHLFRAERDANINMIRCLYYHALPVSLLETADESGMLLRVGGNTFSGFFASKKQMETARQYWQTWIRKYGNHPSIVQWVLNNEACFQGVSVTDEELKEQGDLSAFVKSIDPERLLLQTGDIQLMSAHKRGFSYKPDVFAVHAYGNPYVNAALKLMADYGYDSSIPWDCDEIYPGRYITDDLDFGPGNYIKFRTQVTARYEEIADFYRASLKGIAEAGAAGGSPCTLYSTGYFGPLADGTMYLGPWNIKDVHAYSGISDIRRETQVRVNVPWPSVSGSGVKELQIKPYKYEHVINWFDSSRPVCRKTIIHDSVKKANAEIHGNSLAPIPPEIPPEILIKVLHKGKAVQDAFVSLMPDYESSSASGAITDHNGMAWIRVKNPGSHTLTVRSGEFHYSGEIAIKKTVLSESAGYDFLQCHQIDENGIRPSALDPMPVKVHRPSPEVIKKVEEKLIEFREPEMMSPPLTLLSDLKEGNVEFSEDRKLLKIPVKEEITAEQFFVEMDICPDKVSGEIYLLHCWAQGKEGFYVRIDNGLIWVGSHKKDVKILSLGAEPLTPGEEKHIVIQFFKDTRGGRAVIYIDGEFAGSGECVFPRYWLINSLEVGGNRFIHTRRAFSGKIKNLNIGIGYVDKKTVATRFEKAVRSPFVQGDIKLSPEGFVTDWLVLGPFPNPGKGDGFAGMNKDWLWEQGGEKNINPTVNQEAIIQFHDLDVWNSVAAKYRWRTLHSDTEKVDLAHAMKRAEWGLFEAPAYVVGYAANTLHVNQDGQYKISIGSDDGHKLWVNGVYVGGDLTHGPAVKNRHSYEVFLKKGANHIVLKIDQSLGEHAFYFRIWPMQDEQTEIFIGNRQ